MDIEKLRQKLSQINHEKVKGILQGVIRKELEATVIDTLVEENWRRGLIYAGVGSDIYAWDEYEEYKRSLNPLAKGRVDLILEGGFSNALFIPENDNIIDIDSRDWKRDRLINHYDETIFELSQPQEKDIIDEAVPMVYEEIFDFLNG